MERENLQEYKNETLRQELEVMYEMDQAVRLQRDKFTFEESLEIDRKHKERLKEIIKEYGWPKISEVGQVASQAAWLVAQHTYNDVPFQEECLNLLQEAAENGEADMSHVGYLIDRIRVRKGLPQIYGTQWGYKDAQGNIGPYPIEDQENLDQRRAKMGMGSFAEYAKSFEKRENG